MKSKKLTVGFVIVMMLFLNIAFFLFTAQQHTDIYGSIGHAEFWSRLTILDTGILDFGSRLSGEKIYSDSTDKMTIDSDDEVEINTDTLDINADVVDISGALTAGSITGFEQDTSLWANSPGATYNRISNVWTYEEEFIGIPLDSANGIAQGDAQQWSTNATMAGWYWLGDDGADLDVLQNSVGGIIDIAPDSDTNDETYHRLGEYNEQEGMFFSSNNNKEWWFDTRWQPLSNSTAGMIFVGVGSQLIANYLGDNGISFQANRNVVGFAIYETNPDTVLFVYQSNGESLVVQDTLHRFLGAVTATTFGMYFDGATTLSYFCNDSLIGTCEITATGFPDVQLMAPVLAVKNGTGTRHLRIDYIKMIGDR